jgi:hypothetical protein
MGMVKELEEALHKQEQIMEKQRNSKVRSRQKYSDIESKERVFAFNRRRATEIKDREMGKSAAMSALAGQGQDRALRPNMLFPQDQEVVERDDQLDIERAAEERWMKHKQRIEDIAIDMGYGIEELKSRAMGIKDELGKQDKKLDKLDDVMEKASGELETSTKRMKVLLAKVRANDRCCVTICLLIILVALLTIGYNMVSA